MNTKSIYKTPEDKARILDLYEQRLALLSITHTTEKIETSLGTTHITKMGKEDAPPVIILHGINSGAPDAMEATQPLAESYHLIIVDTVGQATKSAETRPDLKGDAIGHWMVELLDALDLQQVPVIGVSYGGFILQKLLIHASERVSKAILVVPAAINSGPFWASMYQLSFPLMRFLWTKKDSHLRSFLQAFLHDPTPLEVATHRAILLGTHMDYRRPALFQPNQTAVYKGPVYIMTADNDIFFPGETNIKRVKELYSGFQESHLLKNCKHVPPRSLYPELAAKIQEWLDYT